MKPGGSGRNVARALAYAFALALLAIAAAARGAPVALVTDVVGDAQAGGEPLRILAELDANREIVLAAGSNAVVFYVADGREYTLVGPGRYRLDAKRPEPFAGTEPPRTRDAPPALRNIRLRQDRVTQGGILLRGSPRPALVTPVGETVVDREIRFAWEGAGDGTVYQFELVDQSGQRLLGAETSDTEIRLPDAVALRAGEVFYWAIRGRAPGGASFYRAAEFRIADALTQRRVDAARPGGDAPFSERVLFAALLEEVGAKTAAEAQRRALAAERPAGWAPPR